MSRSGLKDAGTILPTICIGLSPAVCPTTSVYIALQHGDDATEKWQEGASPSTNKRGKSADFLGVK
jgi:hypothetical protein